MMKTILVILCASMMLRLSAAERFEVWPAGRMPSHQSNQHTPYFLWHTPSALKIRSVIILVSGGGYYGNDAAGLEVAALRDYLLAKGMTVVTLQYRMPRPEGLPKHLPAWQDVQRTVRMVRKLTRERGLDTSSIGFSGFSAGGHLAMLAAVSSQTKTYDRVDGLDDEPCNVDWAMPVYPAYLLLDGLDEPNVRKGNDLSEGFAPELEFDSATPPMCFFHGDRDEWSAMGSLRACHKLRMMGIPAEMHLLALEGHFFQLHQRPGSSAAVWMDTAWAWLVSMDIVTGHPQVWRREWRTPFPLWSDKPLTESADFKPGSWELTMWGGSVLAAKADGVFWLKDVGKDFGLDFEYRLLKGSESCVVVGRDAVPLPPSVGPGRQNEWNRMTVCRRNGLLDVILNGKSEKTMKPLSYKGILPYMEAVGFSSGTGGRPCFRNIHIR